jgi:hypothetical protein
MVNGAAVCTAGGPAELAKSGTTVGTVQRHPGASKVNLLLSECSVNTEIQEIAKRRLEARV